MDRLDLAPRFPATIIKFESKAILVLLPFPLRGFQRVKLDDGDFKLASLVLASGASDVQHELLDTLLNEVTYAVARCQLWLQNVDGPSAMHKIRLPVGNKTPSELSSTVGDSCQCSNKRTSLGALAKVRHADRESWRREAGTYSTAYYRASLSCSTGTK